MLRLAHDSCAVFGWFLFLAPGESEPMCIPPHNWLHNIIVLCIPLNKACGQYSKFVSGQQSLHLLPRVLNVVSSHPRRRFQPAHVPCSTPSHGVGQPGAEAQPGGPQVPDHLCRQQGGGVEDAGPDGVRGGWPGAGQGRTGWKPHQAWLSWTACLLGTHVRYILGSPDYVLWHKLLRYCSRMQTALLVLEPISMRLCGLLELGAGGIVFRARFLYASGTGPMTHASQEVSTVANECLSTHRELLFLPD